MKIVIVGSGGRLGAALQREWSAAGDEVIGFTHRTLDIADPAAAHAALESLQFDVLVNCAAQTNVDRCETHRDEAFAVNAHAVRTLAEICRDKHARCIHVSTDYVFDGEKRNPYTEEDEAKPISLYGESKLAGEQALLAVSDAFLAVRVSWVFGPDRPSFIDAILKRAAAEENVDAIADKVAVPTFTVDAATLLRPFLLDIPARGVLHLCNGGACSWQQYGQYAIDCAISAGVPMKARTVAPIKMADLTAFIAKRPPYTAMSMAKLSQLCGLTPRSWQLAVEDYVGNFWAPRALAAATAV